MANSYSFRVGGRGSSTLIPVTDGDYFVTEIDPVYERGQCCLRFLNNGVVTTPTAGTIRFRAACVAGQYLTDSQDSTIQATDVQAGDADYTPAVFNGPAIAAKMTLAGITGVTHVEAIYTATT